jgi:Spy/CpxP family protein refolding chaperone
MKLVPYLIACSMLFVGIATAQPPRQEEAMERMAVLLDLDDYQRTEVQRILEEQRSAAKAAREAMRESDQRPSREEMAAHRQQAAESTLVQLQSVLTPEQITKFQALMDRPRGSGPRGGGRHGQPGADL